MATFRDCAMADDIAEIRAFNRFYTRQIGLLEERFADGPLTLPEARVLYEIDTRGHTTATELMRVLDIDRGRDLAELGLQRSVVDLCRGRNVSSEEAQVESPETA